MTYFLFFLEFLWWWFDSLFKTSLRVLNMVCHVCIIQWRGKTLVLFRLLLLLVFPFFGICVFDLLSFTLSFSPAGHSGRHGGCAVYAHILDSFSYASSYFLPNHVHPCLGSITGFLHHIGSHSTFPVWEVTSWTRSSYANLFIL